MQAITEDPALRTDLWVIFQCDAIDWITHREDLGLLVDLIGRLQYEPRSLVRARNLGSDEWVGWGFAELNLSNIYDVLAHIVKTTALHKAKYTATAYRPGADNAVDNGKTVKNTVHKASSVMQLNWGDALEAAGI